VADEWVTQLLRQEICEGIQEILADEASDEAGGVEENQSQSKQRPPQF
jgi:hypothetical protein